MISNREAGRDIRRNRGAYPKTAVTKKRKRLDQVDAKEQDRESLIREFAPMIKFMALRLVGRMPSGLSVDDLISVGTLGLLDAFSKFDPTREIKFRTYAEYRIRGAILDEIRSMDWVPRSIRKRVGKIQQVANDYTQRNSRPPTEAELAAELGMATDEISEILLQAKGAVLVSLEDLGTQDEENQCTLRELVDRDRPNPLESLLAEDNRRSLAASIDRLPERERLILTLYHYEELTMKEIGAVLNVTESRICQLHAQAMVRLRALLFSCLSR